MPINSDDITVLCGSSDFASLRKLRRLPVFSDVICGFLDSLSSEIMKDSQAKAFPDVMTFGFFCRKGNIQRQKEAYKDRTENRLGRGVSFHIAPSNVPVNFAYSMAAALLAGNSCIVRASSKDFRQTDIICGCIEKVFLKPEYSFLKNYICVVKYPHISEITDHFSALCDIRVIWGGDETIAEIRRSPLPPRAVEITFADRYSLAVFDVCSVAECSDIDRLAQDFYNDTYLYDQNACSSPRLIYWLGSDDEAAAASERFWEAVHRLLLKKYKLEPVVAVDKYTAACRAAIELGAKITPETDNLVSRIKLDYLPENIDAFRCAGGSFPEYTQKTLDPLADIVTEKFQTLSYYGADRQMLADFVIKNGLSGVDRIVPVGKTTDFSLIWDGYDLIMNMSRIVDF